MSWLEARGESRPQGYDVAQVCLSGHPVNAYSGTQPGFNQDHCDKCGARTITECPTCSNPIQGSYLDEFTHALFEAPKFCHKCGDPFPWTSEKINAAIELSVEDGSLTEDDAQQFAESVEHIVRDTPRTPLAATRVKRLLTKVGEQTATAVRDILVDIASEAAKKVIWPDR